MPLYRLLLTSLVAAALTRKMMMTKDAIWLHSTYKAVIQKRADIQSLDLMIDSFPSVMNVIDRGQITKGSIQSYVQIIDFAA